MVPIRFQIMLTSDCWDCDAMLGGDAMRYAIIVLALLVVLVSPRPADAITGNKLLWVCTPRDDSYCTGYVMGWVDAHLFPARVLLNGVYFPNGITLGQIKNVLLKYLRDHPALMVLMLKPSANKIDAVASRLHFCQSTDKLKPTTA